MLRILIADDHPIVREGIKRILADTYDLIIADEAGDSRELYSKVRENDYDLVSLELSMPGEGGLDAIEKIRRIKATVPVLVLSVQPEAQYALRAFRTGAAGYLAKESTPEEFLAAVRRIREGGRYVSPTLAERLAGAAAGESIPPLHELLSQREYQIFCRIAAGKPAGEIAAELCLSPRTVSTYRSRILRKMGLENNGALIYYAARQGLVG